MTLQTDKFVRLTLDFSEGNLMVVYKLRSSEPNLTENVLLAIAWSIKDETECKQNGRYVIARPVCFKIIVSQNDLCTDIEPNLSISDENIAKLMFPTLNFILPTKDVNIDVLVKYLANHNGNHKLKLKYWCK